MFRYNIVM